MLKWLAILGLLVPLATVGVPAGQDAPNGTPKQGIVKQEPGKKRQEQPQAQPNNQPTPNPPPAAPQPTAPSCDEACQQGRENLKVQNRLAWLTFGLVVVGAFQVGGMIWQAILIRQTRSDVHTQAEWMEKQAGYMKDQTKILRGSVAVAQTSADAAMAQIQLMKNRERGRLRIEFGPPDLVSYPDPDNGYELPFTITLDGASHVYVTADSCFAAVRDSRKVPAKSDWWRGMGVSGTITPEDRIFKGTVTILTNEEPWAEPFTQDPDQQRVALVQADKLHIFVRVKIAYEDIFGDEWELRFNRQWHYSRDLRTFDGFDLSNGQWLNIGDDGVYRIEREDPPFE